MDDIKGLYKGDKVDSWQVKNNNEEFGGDVLFS